MAWLTVFGRTFSVLGPERRSGASLAGLAIDFAHAAAAVADPLHITTDEIAVARLLCQLTRSTLLLTRLLWHAYCVSRPAPHYY